MDNPQREKNVLGRTSTFSIRCRISKPSKPQLQNRQITSFQFHFLLGFVFIVSSIAIILRQLDNQLSSSLAVAPNWEMGGKGRRGRPSRGPGEVEIWLLRCSAKKCGHVCAFR